MYCTSVLGVPVIVSNMYLRKKKHLQVHLNKLECREKKLL